MFKKKAKQNNRRFLKLFTHILLLFLSPVVKLAMKFRKNYPFKEYDAFLVPIPQVRPWVASRHKYMIIHDLIAILYPEYAPKKWKDWRSDIHSAANDYYFTISSHTKKDFLINLPVVNPNKVKVISLACDEIFKPCTYKNDLGIVRKKYGVPLDKKYVFSLCTLDPRKNLIRTVKTFVEFIQKHKIEDLVFILGGGYWKHFIAKFEQMISSLEKFKDKVIYIGYVDDKDLPILFSGAEWFVYTSAYEGFGLPPLEAMSCGCPVITSNNSSLPEVVGDAGIMIDWDSEEQHIQAYEKYYFDENLRNKNSHRGLLRAKTFSWEKCVDQIVSTMKENLY